MGRRGLVNLVLLGIVAVLAAIAYLRPGGPSSADQVPLTRLSPDSVTRILIQRPPDTEILIERTPGGWRIRRPRERTADGPRIARLLQILATPSHRRFPVDPQRLGDYGLASPLARLTLDGELLEIGGTEPLGRLRYVRIANQIHLIDDLYLPLLLGPPESLVDHRLLPEGTRVAKATLPGGKIITRGEPGSDPWLDAWAGARAVQVAAAPETKGDETLVLQTAVGPEIRFELLTDGDWRLLVDRDRGLAYRLPGDSPLLKAPEDAPQRTQRSQRDKPGKGS